MQANHFRDDEKLLVRKTVREDWYFTSTKGLDFFPWNLISSIYITLTDGKNIYECKRDVE